MSATVVTPKMTDRGAMHDPGLEIHLYDRGAAIALCGHRKGSDAHALPFVIGTYDCEICWGMHMQGFKS
jgi:hypothetical protein